MERAEIVLTMDASQPEVAFPQANQMEESRAAAVQSPMLLYVEQATTDGSARMSISGWVVSREQILAVQVFHGETRLGLAKSGLDREDVGNHYASYPNARNSGFELNLTRNVPEVGAEVTVEAIARSGNVYEVTVVLSPEPEPVVAPPPPEPAGPAPQDEIREPAIDLQCDEALLFTTGTLTVAGWSIGEDGIQSVRLLLDGAEIGEAELGRLSPDVGRTYSSNPHAWNSGYRFERKVMETAEGSHELAVIARNGAGQEKTLAFPLSAIEDDGAHGVVGELGADAGSDLRLHIDLPLLQNDKVGEAVTTRLTIHGWALARDGVAVVEVFIDGQSAGSAYYGQRREDIAAVFPDRENALLSGFVFSFPSHLVQRLAPGEHRVELRLTTETGEQTSRSFLFDRSEEQEINQLFRERISIKEAELYGELLASLEWNPRFKIVLVSPEGQDAEREAAETLRSLSRQVFGQWEIISLESLDQTLGAEQAETAPTFFFLLRAGDVLSCDALAEIAVATGLHRATDLLYCDEIRTSPATKAREAFFKPRWSPDLLLSNNYIGRPCRIRAGLMQRADIKAADLEQFGEYDLVLRCTEQASEIRHLPKLLGQRGANDEPEAMGQAALERAAERRGIATCVARGPLPGTYHFKRTDEPAGKVSIIIPTAGVREHVRTCIETIRRHTAYRNYEILCIDNIKEADSAWKPWLRETRTRSWNSRSRSTGHASTTRAPGRRTASSCCFSTTTSR
jgi:hypothetical protein